MSIDRIPTPTTAAGMVSGPSDDPMRAPLASGDAIGRYVILRQIGAGGMGIVYLAYDPDLDRNLAIKVLHPRRLRNKGSRRARQEQRERGRLMREAQAMARLSHPNVVSIHDVGEHDGRVFIAMEFIDGETLEQWLRSDRTWRDVLEVFVLAARGLTAAHKKGLVHRDFKPENVLIGPDRRVYVMDFGLARPIEKSGELVAMFQPAAPVPSPENTADSTEEKTTDETAASLRRPSSDVMSENLTVQGARVGTPAYMSPEQLQGRVADERSDQFSFCVALWEALYGQRPFRGHSVYELSESVLEGVIEAPPRNDVPRWLRAIVERGLQTDPQARFASMRALLLAIEHGRNRRRRNRGFIMGTAALAALAAGFGGLKLNEHRKYTACEAQGNEIDQVWNAEREKDLKLGLLSSGANFAATTADKVIPRIKARANQWRASQTAACLRRTVEKRWTDSQIERAQWCLDERRMMLDEVIARLSQADANTARYAVHAVAALPNPATCIDEAAVAAMVDPPDSGAREEASVIRRELVEAAVLSANHEHDRGMEVARSASRRASALGFAPLLAEARWAEGRAYRDLDRETEAYEAFLEAYQIAAKARAWQTAAEAAASLITQTGLLLGRYDDAHQWAIHAAIAADLAGDPDGLREANRLERIAHVHTEQGNFRAALDEAERAHDLVLATLGPDHPDIAETLSGQGASYLRLGDVNKALDFHQRALASFRAAYGDNHPRVAWGIHAVGNTLHDLGDDHGAIERYNEALEIMKTALGPDHPEVATRLQSLSEMATFQGDHARAIALARRALEIKTAAYEPDNHDLAHAHLVLATALIEYGDYDEPLVHLERARAIYGDSLAADDTSRRYLADMFGYVYLARKDHVKAVEFLSRGLALQEAHGGPRNPGLVTGLTNLAAARLELGEFDLTRQHLERALEILEGSVGTDHIHAAYVRLGLAELGLREGDFVEAEKQARLALEVRRHHRVGETLLAEAEFTMAKAIWAGAGRNAKRRTEARELAARAHQVYVDHGKPETSVQEIVDWLGEHR